MNELPDGWVITEIDSITSRPLQKNATEEEQFFYIDIGSVDRESKKIFNPESILGKDAPSRARQIVQDGDVLVSMTRPNLNAVALVSKAYDQQIASTGFDVLRPIKTDPRWLYTAVRTKDFVDAMSDLVQGALYPAVRPRDIRAYEIPLPPLPEQKRIADKLDTLLARVDATRERLERIPAILQRFRQSVLAAGISGRLTEKWRKENLIEFEWKETSLQHTCRSITDGDHQAPPKVDAGVPFITISTMNDGIIRLNNSTRFVPKSYFDQLKEGKKPRLDDILYSVTGSICIPAIVTEEVDFVFQRHIAILKPDNNVVLPKFLYFWLRSDCAKQQGFSVATGTAQLTIPLNGLRGFEINIPSLIEQNEIVRRVESLFTLADRLETRYNTARAQVDKLTPALLAKAFRGELVEQDLNDEPAAVLLERIKAERETARQQLSAKKKAVKKVR